MPEEPSYVRVNSKFLESNRFPYNVIKIPVQEGTGDFSVTPNTGIPGTPILLTPIKSNPSYEFSRWELEGIEESELFFNFNGSFYFLLPENDVSVGAKFIPES